MSDPEYDPRKLPNFDALRDALAGRPSREAIAAWVEKLEEWSKATVAEIDRLDREETLTERRLEEAEGAKDELEALQEKVLDVERGIIDVSELVGEVVRS